MEQLHDGKVPDMAQLVARCETIRQHAKVDLEQLRQGLDNFLADELQYEDNRHDTRQLLYNRFDTMKREIDNAVSIGSADYRFCSAFELDEDDRAVLRRMKTSSKALRKRAVQSARTAMAQTARNILKREKQLSRDRGNLGVLAASAAWQKSGHETAEAAAAVMEPRTGGLRTSFSR